MEMEVGKGVELKMGSRGKILVLGRASDLKP